MGKNRNISMNNHLEQKEVFKTVSQIVADLLSIDSTTITLDSSFDELGADSLDMLEIIMKIEETYSIEISDEQAASIKTIKQMVEKVQSTQ